MSNYSKSTNFATKDSLATGNPLKVIKGTEIDDEFEAIETSIATKLDSASPTITGTATIAAATITTGTVTTANITTLNLGNWVVSLDGSNNLVFNYNGTDVFKVETTGAVTSADDVTAFGTI